MENKRLNYREMEQLLKDSERMKNMKAEVIDVEIRTLIKDEASALFDTTDHYDDLLVECQFGWTYRKDLQKFNRRQIIEDFAKWINRISAPQYKIRKFLSVVMIPLYEHGTYFVTLLLKSELTKEELQKLLSLDKGEQS